MQPSSEIFKPWRLYSRAAWAALAGAVLSVLCGILEPFALIPAVLLALTSVALFWLAARPVCVVSPARFTIGARAIAWQEICAIEQVCASPLILRLALTNRRRKLLVYTGEPRHAAELVAEVRDRAFRATFDGVPYRDYQLWAKLSETEAGQLGLQEPKKMASAEEEREIERLFQLLKASGTLDGAPPAPDRAPDPSAGVLPKDSSGAGSSAGPNATGPNVPGQNKD